MATAPRQHRRHNDPDDFEGFHEREYDVSKKSKINKFLDDWKIVWIIGFPLFLAFGFNFKTPGSQFEELHRNQEEIAKQILETNRIIGILVFLRCEDISERQRDLRLQPDNRIVQVQLNCSDVYRKIPDYIPLPK